MKVMEENAKADKEVPIEEPVLEEPVSEEPVSEEPEAPAEEPAWSRKKLFQKNQKL